MKIIDLSHIIDENTTVYPGSDRPIVEKLDIPDYADISVQKYVIEGHIGTHIDTPKHFFSEKNNTETCNLNMFYGKAIVLDVENFLNGREIIPEILDSVNDINSFNFIIFYTAWFKKWESKSYFTDFPVISKDLANILAKSNVTGLGFDAISIDTVESTELPNHKIILGADKIIVENLTNIEQLVDKIFTLSCLPLKFRNGDGSPVRAVAIL